MLSLRHTPKYDFSLCFFYSVNCLNSLQGPVLTFHCVVGKRMKVEGAPRFLKAFWNPEVSWILRSPRGLSRIALNSESITSGGPWAPALILQGVHCPLPPALCPQVGFICPMSALKQPPASTLLSKHLCLQRCLVGLGGLF